MELDEFKSLSQKLDATQFWVLSCIKAIQRETSISEIAEIVPLTKRTIQRAVKELKKSELIKVRPEKRYSLISENIASLVSQSENEIASVVSQSREIASCVSQSKDEIASYVSQSRKNASCVSQLEGEIASCMSQSKENASCVSQSEDEIASCMSQSKENASCVSQSKDEIASVVSQSEIEKQAKIPQTLTIDDFQAALPNLNLKNTKIKELIKYKYQEDPIHAHADASPVRVCAPASEGGKTVESEIPKGSEQAGVCATENGSDLAQISPAMQTKSEPSMFGYSDNYRRFEEQFKQKPLPIWRKSTGNGGIDERFIEFIRKTLDKMGGEHTRGDAIIYITRREKLQDFDTLEARAADWLNEEKRREQTMLRQQRSIAKQEPKETVDVSDVQSRIDVELVRLKWTKEKALKHMIEVHGWVDNIVLRKAMEEKRFDRLTEEDLVEILLKLKEVGE